MDTFAKQLDEKYSITVDFSAVLSTGETISTKTVTATLAGVVVTSTVIDSSAIVGETIVITVKEGAVNDYKITILITTSAENIYEEDVLMQVRDY